MRNIVLLVSKGTSIRIGKTPVNFKKTVQQFLLLQNIRGFKLLAVTLLILIIGLCLALIGLLGCILPVLPGPPLSFLSLIILSWAKNWEPFSFRFLCIVAVLTAAISLLDYVLPAGGAKKYGASRWGVWGSLIGMPVGLLFFPPWGIIIGGMAGALLGEMITGKETGKALQASWGIFIGYMLSTGLKVLFCTVMLFFYLKEMF